MRDGNGPRALQTLIRNLSSVLAKLFRALGPLETLRAPGARHPAPAVLDYAGAKTQTNSRNSAERMT